MSYQWLCCDLVLTQADKEAWYCSTIKVICLSEQVTTGSVRLRVSPADEKLPSGVKVRGHWQSRIYAFLSLSVREIHLPLCWALCSYGSRYWRAFVHIKDTSAQQVSCFRSDNILLANVLLLRAVPCVCVTYDTLTVSMKGLRDSTFFYFDILQTSLTFQHCWSKPY